MNFSDIHTATIAAKKTMPNIGVSVKAGQFIINEVQLNSNGASVVTPLSNPLALDACYNVLLHISKGASMVRLSNTSNMLARMAGASIRAKGYYTCTRNGRTTVVVE